MVLDQNQIAQSLRAVSGRNFELVVAEILNNFLISDGIVITRAREPALSALIQNESNLRRIMDFTKVPVKRRCDQAQLEDYPDLDLFALMQPATDDDVWKLLAIINCKVSFHARHTEATFWGLLVRLSSNIPFVVVTEDRDIYNANRSELGASCNESTVTRRLLESFTDGIYLVKRYQDTNDSNLHQDISNKRQYLQDGLKTIVFDDPNVPSHTQYCQSVRPIDDLIDDLLRWRTEVVRRAENE